MPASRAESDRERPVDDIQRDTLYAHTEPNEKRPQRTVDEHAREHHQPHIRDHLNELHRAGLVHWTSDGYVFASRSALKQIELVGRVA